MRRPKGLSIDKGQYCKAVGYAMTKGGGVRARTHYLGTNASGALKAAERIKARWDANDGTAVIFVGGKAVKVWAESTPTPAASVPVAPIATETPSVAMPIAIAPTVAAPTRMTIGQAREQYLAGIKERVDAGQCSRGHWVTETFNTAPGVELLGIDRPLASIGATEITRAVLTLAARPIAKRNNYGRKATNETPEETERKIKASQERAKEATERLSVPTVKAYIKAMKRLFEWMATTEAEGSNVPLWVMPLKFKEIFKANQPIVTEDEKDAMLDNDGSNEPDAFSLIELRQLYQRANDRQRLWLLMSLNCGLTQMELATIRLTHLRGLDGDNPAIKKFRNKTDIYAEWSLWPETAAWLRTFLEVDAEKIKATKAVLLTEDGKTLVESRGMGRRDAVKAAWDHIREVLPEGRRLSFKYVRKSGARLIRHGYGDQLAEMYLSHADDDSGVLKAYSPRDWARLAEALVEVRKQLLSGWEMPTIALKHRGRKSYETLTSDRAKEAAVMA